jgi:hypothetical protein
MSFPLQHQKRGVDGCFIIFDRRTVHKLSLWIGEPTDSWPVHVVQVWPTVARNHTLFELSRSIFAGNEGTLTPVSESLLRSWAQLLAWDRKDKITLDFAQERQPGFSKAS